MARYKNSKNHKPKSQINKELKVLKSYWGCIPMQYYTHDFYRKDCELYLDEMKEHIPGYYFYNVIYPKFDDIKKAKGALENKILSYFVFEGMNLPTTQMIALKKGMQVLTPTGLPIDDVLLQKLINSTNENKIFIKPVEGKGGVGILVAKRSENCFELNNRKLMLDNILDLNGDFVIEKQVVQASYLNAIYSHSVNTLRAVTKRNSKGEVELIAVTLRMGTGGREVDNSHLGGLLIGIDVLTGKPVRQYAGYEYGAEKITHHPDTNYKFSQLEIINWEIVSKQILIFAEKMLLQNLIGWDIALTEEGPLVIEANTMFGIDHSQSGVGGMRDLFKAEMNSNNGVA